MKLGLIVAIAAAFALIACIDDDPIATDDASLPDAGTMDASPGDAVVDAGPEDSGVPGSLFPVQTLYYVEDYREDGETNDTTVIQRAVDAAGQNGGGIVVLAARTYTVDRSIQLGQIYNDGRDKLDGYSNVWVRGAGRDETLVRCTAALNGADDLYFNNVFNANNLFPTDRPVSQYETYVWVSDMTIDGSAQSDDGFTNTETLGFSLAAIEFQNVHNARAFRLRVKGAYGNGIVMGSIDPGVEASIQNGIVEDVVFEDCIRGILANYGITGSVVQFGAMVGGVIRNCQFIESGGPAIDFFNCNGTHIENNTFTGVGTTPIGPGQIRNSIHSDFGLVDVTIRENVLQGVGQIFLSGVMQKTFFNDAVPTPGPQRCRIEDNALVNVDPSVTYYGAITVVGGTYQGPDEVTPEVPIVRIGRAENNAFVNNVIVNAPTGGILLVDAQNNSFVGNQIVRADQFPFYDQDYAIGVGAISRDNMVQANFVIDSRPTTHESAPIFWVTDEPSDSQVEYGATAEYGTTTTIDPAFVTTHLQTVSGLAPDTVYHFRVKSRTAGGTLRVSRDYELRTQPAPL